MWNGKIKLEFYIFPLKKNNGNFTNACMLLCLTLCDTMDSSLPGSSVHGIFQARILERIAISYSRGFSNPGIGKSMSSTSPALQIDSLPLNHQGNPFYI